MTKQLSSVMESEVPKFKKKAFTLAEVLITLAIIGVVAALTIPTVVSKYQKHQYYTQFRKMFNTLSEALALAQAENGSYGGWQVTPGGSYETQLKEYFVPKLKISKTCSSVSECGAPSDIEFHQLGGSAAVYNTQFFGSGSDRVGYLLNDGSFLTIDMASSGLSYTFIYIDTNGFKGPNIVGRDIFSLKINQAIIDSYHTTKNNYVLKPLSSYSEGTPDTTFNLMGREVVMPGTPSNCDPLVSGSSGWGCADRLLIDNKMNY